MVCHIQQLEGAGLAVWVDIRTWDWARLAACAHEASGSVGSFIVSLVVYVLLYEHCVTVSTTTHCQWQFVWSYLDSDDARFARVHWYLFFDSGKS